MVLTSGETESTLKAHVLFHFPLTAMQLVLILLTKQGIRKKRGVIS